MTTTPKTFEYNAPQFIDLKVGLDDSDGADTFFDVETDFSQIDNENKENEAKSPVKRRSLTARRRLSAVKESLPIAKVAPRVSLKGEDNLSDGLSQLTVRAKKRTHFEGIEINEEKEKEHCMTTRRDEAVKTPLLELRSRSVIREEEAPASRKRKSTGHHPEMYMPGHKYMALAEQVRNFQAITPPRFHTRRKRSSGGRKSLLAARTSYVPRRTIAHTPKLLTAMRRRPSMVMSREQMEEQEMEEIKKQQIKALPLNENVFKAPELPKKSTRENIKVEPFNLTQVFKKPVATSGEEPFKFTAKPVPKKILAQAVGVGPKVELPVTVPQSPAITKPRFHKPIRVARFTYDCKETVEELYSFGVPTNKSTLLKKTEIQPFSFDGREKERQEKKQQKIQEIFEAERKAREFKANPAPQFHTPKHHNRPSKFHDASKVSVASTSSYVEPPPKPFKAKSPRVLREPPFTPNLEHNYTRPEEINLKTERRAHERELFEIKQQEREEYLAYHREQREQERKQQEAEEIAHLRKEIVHKPLPMPKFKTPIKKNGSSIPLTQPQSPRFSKRTRTGESIK